MERIRFVLRILINLVVGFWLTVPILFRKGQHQERIIIDVKPHHLDRYLLNFVRFSGETKTVVFPFSRKLITQIGSNYFQAHKKYGSLLATSPEIIYRLFPERKKRIVINDNYWTEGPDARWPLGVHPFYEDLLVQASRIDGEVMFFGNDAIQYSKCFDESLWGMPNRSSQLDFVKKELTGIEVRGVVPFTEYVQCLRRADFFLCLPGVSWPLCHNLFEAVSNGAIPILHTNYLKLLPSNIQEILSSYSYNSMKELNDLVYELKLNRDLAKRAEVRKALEIWCSHDFGRKDLLLSAESRLELTILNSRCTNLLKLQC